MGQEDFARLGFEIDIKNAQAAFTRIAGRLTALEKQTTDVSRNISQALSDAFGGQISKSPIENISKDMKLAATDAEKYANKLRSAMVSSIKAIKEAREVTYAPGKTGSAQADRAKETIDGIKKALISEVNDLKRVFKGVTPEGFGLELVDDFYKKIDAVRNGIGKQFQYATSVFHSATFDQDSYKNLVDLYKMTSSQPKIASGSGNSFDEIAKGVERLAALGNDARLTNVITAITSISKLAKNTDIVSFANALKEISTFQFNDNNAKEIIQNFIDLRKVIKQEDTGPAKPFFDVDKTNKEFESKLLPALKKMRKKVVAELTKLDSDGIKIPVTFDVETPEYVAEKITNHVSKIKAMIDEGKSKKTWPTITIGLKYETGKMLFDLKKELYELPLEQRPVVPIVAGNITIDPQQVQKAVELSTAMKELQENMSKPLAMAKIDLAPFYAINAKLKEIKAAASEASIAIQSISTAAKSDLQAVVSEAQKAIDGMGVSTKATVAPPTKADTTNLLTSIASLQTAIQKMAENAGKNTQIKLNAPIIAPITNRAIDTIVQEAQAKMNDRHIRSTVSIIPISKGTISTVIQNAQAILDGHGIKTAITLVPFSKSTINSLIKNTQAILDELSIKSSISLLPISKKAIVAVIKESQEMLGMMSLKTSISLSPIPHEEIQKNINALQNILNSVQLKLHTVVIPAAQEKLSKVIADAQKQLNDLKLSINTTILPVTQSGIKPFVADLQAKISAIAIKTSPIQVALPLKKDVSAAISAINAMFKDAKTKAIPFQVDTDNAVTRIKRITEQLKDIPKRFPVPTIAKSDLELLNTYAKKIYSIARSMEFLRNIEVVLRPIQPFADTGTTPGFMAGTSTEDLKKKKDELEKQFTKQKLQISKLQESNFFLDPVADKTEYAKITKEIAAMGNEAAKTQKSLQAVNDELEKKKNAKVLMPETVKALADTSAEINKTLLTKQFDTNSAKASAVVAEAQAKAQNNVSKSIENTGTVLKNINKDYERSTNAFKANTESLGQFSDTLKTAEWEGKNATKAMLDLGQSMKTLTMNPDNLVDPLKRLRAELRLTNNSTLDMLRSMGMYMSARTVVSYFQRATDAAVTFGYEVRRIQSLATNFDFGQLYKGLMDLDARFGNVAHNARALYWAYSSGVRGTESELVRFTEIMSKTATTINADVMPTVDAATAIMNAYGLSASRASEVSDLMFTIVKEGKASARELTSSLGNIIATASSLGVSLNDLGAAAATLTKTMRTNKAFTYLNNIMGKMVKPTKDISDYAASLGVEFSASAVKAKGFAAVMKELHDATGGNVAMIAKLFPDLRGQRAALTLLSTQYKDFMQQIENFENKTGNMEEALGLLVDTPEAQFKSLRNAMYMLSIEAGNSVRSLITLGGSLEKPLEFFNAMTNSQKKMGGQMMASVGVFTGYILAQKAIAAAHFAAAQANTQLNLSSLEESKMRMQSALNTRQQVAEIMELNLKKAEEHKIAVENNNDMLNSIKIQKIANQQEKEALRLESERLKQARQQAGLTGDSAVSRQMLKLDQDKLALAAMREQQDIIKNDEAIKKAKDARSLELLTTRAHTAALADIRKKELNEGIRYAHEMEEAFSKAGQARYYKGMIGKDDPMYQHYEEQDKKYSAIAYGSHWQQKSAEEQAVVQERINAAYIQAKNTAESLSTVTEQKIGVHQLAANTLDQLTKSQKANIDADMAALNLTKDSIKNNTLKQHVLKELEVSARSILNTEERIRLEQTKLSEMQRIGLPDMEQAISAQRAKVNLLKSELTRMQTDTQTMITNAELTVKKATADGKGQGKRATEDAKKQLDKYTDEMNKRNHELGAKPYTIKPILSEELQLMQKQIAAKEKLIAQAIANTESGKDNAATQRDILALIKERDKIERKMLNKSGAGIWGAGKAAGKMASGTGGFAAMSLMRIGGFMGGPASMLMTMLPVQEILGTAIGTVNASMMKMASTSKLVSGVMKAQGLSAAELSTSLLGTNASLLFSSAAAKEAGISETQLALTRKMAVASVIGIASIAAALGALLAFSTKEGGPMSGIAKKLAGLDKLRERSSALDEIQNLTVERMARHQEFNEQLSLNITTETKQIDDLKNRIEILQDSKASQDEINSAQMKLNSAMERQAELLSIQKEYANSFSDKGSDVYQSMLEQAKKDAADANNAVYKLKKETELSLENLAKNGIPFRGPFVLYKKLFSLGDAEQKQADAVNKITELMQNGPDISTQIALRSTLYADAAIKDIKHSHDDIFMLEKTAAEQRKIQKERYDLMDAQRKALFESEDDITNIYAAYAKEAKKRKQKFEEDQNELATKKEIYQNTKGLLGEDNETTKLAKEQLETAQKNFDKSETAMTGFIEAFKRYTDGMAEQQKELASVTIKAVQEANKNLDRAAKKSAFETDEISAAIIRDREKLKNWTNAKDAPLAMLQETLQEIDDINTKITNIYKQLKNPEKYDTTKEELNQQLVGLETKLNKLKGIEAVRRNIIREYEDEMFAARISAAKNIEGQYNTLIQTQQKIQKFSADIRNELWDKLADDPRKGWLMMRNNLFAQLKELQGKEMRDFSSTNEISMLRKRIEDHASVIGNSEREMMRNRLDMLEKESSAIRRLNVDENLRKAQEMIKGMSAGPKEWVQYTDYIKKAQEGLPEAIDAMKKEISFKQKLADAEQKANQDAQNLAKQLNETFGTTVQSRFDARSTESFKLMNRSIDAMRVGANTTAIKQKEYERSFLNMLSYAEDSATAIRDALQKAEEPLKAAIGDANLESSAALKKAADSFAETTNKFGKHVGAMPSVAVYNI